jgi:hypothetical protein
VRVAGASMAPALRDGDLLGARAPRPDEPHPGQIVVARAAGTGAQRASSARAPGPEIVKRVAVVTATDVVIAGDNAAASTDPPPLARADVTGIVRFRYWPPWRPRLFR